MAQYYNFVTNASGTLTLEEVQRICSVEGQSVQFVVEDVNNGGNGSQQILAYTTAPQNSEQAIISQQAINVGNQITTTQLEQGQNILIIKTNDVHASQNVLKPNASNTCAISENIVGILDNTGSKALLDGNSDTQQIQWVKMQENSTNLNAVLKQNTITAEKPQSITLSRNQSLNSNTSTVPLQGRFDSQTQNIEPVERKVYRLCMNKGRQSLSNVQIGSPATPERTNLLSLTEIRARNSNASNRKPTSPLRRNKEVGPFGQNVTPTITRQVPASPRSDSVQGQSTVSPQMSRNLMRLQCPEMEHLSERIKQSKLKQSQKQQNDLRLQQSNTPRQLSTNASQQSMSNLFNNSVQRQQSVTSPNQQRQQQSVQFQQSPKQTIASPPHKSQLMSPLSPCSDQSVVDSDTTDNTQEKDRQSSPLQDSDCNSTESLAYLQKIIDNPASTIVQHQIPGNNAKMLVVLQNGEQRLITFDIPNEDCTVQDLLEQANITVSSETVVSLVSDPALGINYIVEGGHVTSTDGSENNDGWQESMPSVIDHSQNTIPAPDENSNSSTHQDEEPLYIEGKLALCPNCGIGSLDFRMCERCKKRLPDNVKPIPMNMGVREKKEHMLSVDTFYKKNNERNAMARLERIEREGSASKRGRGRGRGATRTRPIHKEPECLTISSDDEEEGKSKKSENTCNSSALANTNNIFNDDMDTILEKEPVITNDSVCNTSQYNKGYEEGGGKDGECANFSDDILQSQHTSLSCRTVRIGSYKYVPREKVIISQTGIRFSVPLLEDDKSFVTLDVKFSDIVKVLIHFGKSMPVLFVYTSIVTGAHIRELLGMQDMKGPYYDPAGKDHTHKRITLLPEKLSEESKIVLKNIFSLPDLLEELTVKEANDILVRASPKDSLQIQSLTRRHSHTPSTSNTNTNGGIQTITVYPPPPAKGGIAINTEDYSCLGEDQFLNDVIIDFYLKYLTLEVLSESDQNRTHVFSSYFYKRLTSPHAQAGESAVPLTAAAKRHARVQKWTKNVNIFEKDFVIIPINEHAHWFLAIICFPGLVGKVPPKSSNVKQEDVNKTVQKSKKLKEVKLQTVTIGSTTITPVTTTTITIDPGDDGSERDEAEGDEDEMEVDTDDDEEMETDEKKNQQPKLSSPEEERKAAVQIPCILIFDSIAGASRARVVATLRDYLSCEHVAKMGVENTFTKDTIKGCSPKVPQQSNFTDCGLYVLQYVESFFKAPISDYTLPIKSLKNWFEEIVVTRKREELSKLLIKLMNVTKGDKAITLPAVNFPTQDGKLKPKPENHVDVKIKTEAEGKKKSTTDGESRNSNNMPNAVETAKASNDLVTKTTYHIIPYCPTSSSSSSESNSSEVWTEIKTPVRSSSDAMSYLKSKRLIPKQIRTENQDDAQAAKKHKGESFDPCK